MFNVDDHAGLSAQQRSQFLSDRNRAMLTARAPNGDRSVSLVLALVPGEHGRQRFRVCGDEFVRAGAPHDVSTHLGVKAGKRFQFGDPERVGQEAHVGDQVCVRTSGTHTDLPR